MAPYPERSPPRARERAILGREMRLQYPTPGARDMKRVTVGARPKSHFVRPTLP